MSSRTKVVGISVPLIIVAAVVAVLAVWAVMGATGGVKDGVSIKGVIEYSIFDPAGNLKASNAIHNDYTDSLSGDAAGLLTGAAQLSPGYESIAACSNNPNTGLGDGGTPTGCTLQGDAVDGSSENPADGSASVTANAWESEVTFTATAGGTILELQLANTTAGTTAPTPAEIGAVQDVNITLGAGDTLTVTWTVTVG